MNYLFHLFSSYSAISACTVPILLACLATVRAAEPISIGDQRQLFLDDSLIDKLDGVEVRLNHPQAREAAIVFDRPWEGDTSCYVTVFRDTDRFRMYYRGSDSEAGDNSSGEHACYAESQDGIHWTRPDLSLFDFKGSKANNIVWHGPGSHNFTPFKDENPACPPDQQYKAVAGDTKGLLAFASGDGIHWRRLREEPIITNGNFDSQNVVFWDAQRGSYVDFHRDLRDGKRDLRTCTSKDFLNWTEPEWLDWGGTLPIHLYTNAIVLCPGAPHLLIGFPKRFMETRQKGDRPYPGVSDAGLMSSRDGLHWNLWDEAFLRPGLQPSRWGHRNNMIARGILITHSDQPGAPDEFSLYSTEGFNQGKCILRRHTLRVDGFVSLHGGVPSGEVTTKPLIVAASPQSSPAERSSEKWNLTINYSTSAAGSVRCEVLDTNGQAIPGFSIQDSVELYGDELDHRLKWKDRQDVTQLIGRPIRLRFKLEDADLYSFQFTRDSKK